jgi:hypothetical protein
MVALAAIAAIAGVLHAPALAAATPKSSLALATAARLTAVPQVPQVAEGVSQVTINDDGIAQREVGNSIDFE